MSVLFGMLIKTIFIQIDNIPGAEEKCLMLVNIIMWEDNYYKL